MICIACVYEDGTWELNIIDPETGDHNASHMFLCKNCLGGILERMYIIRKVKRRNVFQ